jgi:hypothetical protein
VRDRAPQKTRRRLSKPLSIAFWDFHHVRAPEQPIHAHVETVCDLADAIEIESGATKRKGEPLPVISLA